MTVQSKDVTYSCHCENGRALCMCTDAVLEVVARLRIELDTGAVYAEDEVES